MDTQAIVCIAEIAIVGQSRRKSANASLAISSGAFGVRPGGLNAKEVGLLLPVEVTDSVNRFCIVTNGCR